LVAATKRRRPQEKSKKKNKLKKSSARGFEPLRENPVDMDNIAIEWNF
jgi:hypothetical protein